MRFWVVSLVSVSLLAGCGNPLRDVPRLSDVSVQENAGQADLVGTAVAADVPVPPAAALAPERPRTGFLGFLRKKADTAIAAPAIEQAAVPGDVDAAVNDALGLEAQAPQAEVAALPEAVQEAAAEPAEAPVAEASPTLAQAAPAVAEKPRGLFGILRGARKNAVDPEKVAAVTAPEPAAPAVAEATIIPAALTKPADLPAAETKPRAGLFGALRNGRNTPKAAKPLIKKGPKPGAPDYEIVERGVTLPYGKLARLCGVSGSQVGRKTESYPDRGRGYTIYDSKPGAEGQRSFYVSGFDDGCLRQFTAALVIFGEPEIYEQIRFGKPGKHLPKSRTDAAYDQVKSKVCKVSAGKPCGDRLSRLSRDTVFLSVYERFDSNPRWKTILLHKGEVMAMSIKN